MNAGFILGRLAGGLPRLVLLDQHRVAMTAAAEFRHVGVLEGTDEIRPLRSGEVGDRGVAVVARGTSEAIPPVSVIGPKLGRSLKLALEIQVALVACVPHLLCRGRQRGKYDDSSEQAIGASHSFHFAAL